MRKIKGQVDMDLEKHADLRQGNMGNYRKLGKERPL